MAKKKEWAEDELIKAFSLERLDETYPLLGDWLTVGKPKFTTSEQVFFDDLLEIVKKKADFWNEETLKMRFISPLLTVLVQLDNDKKGRYEGFYDKQISAMVENVYLQTETDFMLAKGIGDIAETPYFHFQEYKRSKKSPPEPMAQLLEAFLIAQAVNKNGKPIYGAVIVGRMWQFVAMQGKKYGMSYLFDSTKKEDLLRIVAVLRQFKTILERDLL